MLNIKPEGVLTLDLSMYSLSNLKSISIRENWKTKSYSLVDAVIPITYDGQFVRRNGKEYYVISNVQTHLNVSRMKLDTKCKNILGWINTAMNNLLNDNWEILKAELDDSLNQYIGNVILSIIQPILNNVAVKDFYTNWT